MSHFIKQKLTYFVKIQLFLRNGLYYFKPNIKVLYETRLKKLKLIFKTLKFSKRFKEACLINMLKFLDYETV